MKKLVEVDEIPALALEATIQIVVPLEAVQRLNPFSVQKMK